MHRTTLLLLAGIALAAVGAAQEAPAPLDHTERLSVHDRPGIHHAAVRGRVVDHEGEPLAGARVFVYAKQPFWFGVPLAEARTEPDGTYAIRDIRGHGYLTIWATTGDAPFARGSTSVILVSGEEVRARTVRLGEPQSELEARTVTGTVQGAEGQPIPGCYLRLLDGEGGFDPGAFATSDADGKFTITTRTGSPARADFYFSGQRLKIEQGDEPELTKAILGWELDMTLPQWRLHSDQFATQALPTGDDDGVSFSTLRAGQWIPCGDRVGGIPSPSGTIYATVRAEKAGHVARILPGKADEPVRFDDSVPVDLTVTGGGRPLAGARVDLSVIRRSDESSMVFVDSTTTDENGRIALAADPESTYVVHVYADGHRAARDVWRAGRQVEIDLTPRSCRLKVAALDHDNSVYVRPAGSFAYVGAAYCRPGETAEFSLAPGSYEITRYGPDNEVFVEGVSLTDSREVMAKLDRDLRPTAVVELPEVTSDKEWWAHGSRSAIRGMVSKWRAYSGADSTPPTRELVAVVEALEDGRKFRLRFPVSGRFTVFCGHPALPHRYFSDVDCELGEETELVLPSLDASVAGRMPSFPDMWTFGGQHGIAGPRLLLRPTAPGEFGIMVGLPEPAEFALEHIPAGRFVVEHHLYTTGFLTSQDGVFGGPSLTVTPGEKTDLGLLEKRGQSVEVLVVDSEGTPWTGHLAIRDRMFEAWHKIVQQGKTLAHALDPIPTPPSVWTEDQPVTLDGVRAGRVEFVFTTLDGRRAWFERTIEAEPDEPIRLIVDLPDGE